MTYRTVRPLLSWLVGAACLTGAAHAAAADCTVLLSDPTVDFGAMRPGTGKDADTMRPSPAQRVYTVACKAPTQMNLVFRTTPAGTAHTAHTPHTGTHEALNFGDAGTYRIRVVDAQLDGNAVQLARLSAIGQAPGEALAGELVLKPNDIIAPTDGQQLLRGAHLSVTLQISARVPADARRVAQQRTLNAASQITLAPR